DTPTRVQVVGAWGLTRMVFESNSENLLNFPDRAAVELELLDIAEGDIKDALKAQVLIHLARLDESKRPTGDEFVRARVWCESLIENSYHRGSLIATNTATFFNVE